jgi:hypothetical protein
MLTMFFAGLFRVPIPRLLWVGSGLRVLRGVTGLAVTWLRLLIHGGLLHGVGGGGHLGLHCIRLHGRWLSWVGGLPPPIRGVLGLRGGGVRLSIHNGWGGHGVVGLLVLATFHKGYGNGGGYECGGVAW